MFVLTHEDSHVPSSSPSGWNCSREGQYTTGSNSHARKDQCLLLPPYFEQNIRLTGSNSVFPVQFCLTVKFCKNQDVLRD